MRAVYLRLLDRCDADPDHYQRASQRLGRYVDEGLQQQVAAYERLLASYQATYQSQR